MSLDEPKAKRLIRAILNEAGGAVGTFVPLAEVLAVAGVGATEVLQELAQRRWIRVRDDEVAATKWALEFGMDWTQSPFFSVQFLTPLGASEDQRIRKWWSLPADWTSVR